MASGTNAFTSRAGFNQSGGAHFMTLAALEPTPGTAATSYVLALVNPGSNSGGAFSNATLSTVTMASIINSGTGTTTTVANAAGFVGANKMLKDMGRTVVSAGRTFRKFAPVVAGLGVSSFGVAGAAAVGANAGFGSFYLEVGREGLTGTPAGLGPAPIVRYF